MLFPTEVMNIACEQSRICPQLTYSEGIALSGAIFPRLIGQLIKSLL